MTTDAYLLPRDGVFDEVAIQIAARGQRRVPLTWQERRAATLEMLLRTQCNARKVQDRLGLPDLKSAENLLARMRRKQALSASPG